MPTASIPRYSSSGSRSWVSVTDISFWPTLAGGWSLAPSSEFGRTVPLETGSLLLEDLPPELDGVDEPS